MAYFHLSVAYIQMLKAFAPAMLLGMFLGESCYLLRGFTLAEAMVLVVWGIVF